MVSVTECNPTCKPYILNSWNLSNVGSLSFSSYEPLESDKQQYELKIKQAQDAKDDLKAKQLIDQWEKEWHITGENLRKAVYLYVARNMKNQSKQEMYNLVSRLMRKYLRIEHHSNHYYGRKLVQGAVNADAADADAAY